MFREVVQRTKCVFVGVLVGCLWLAGVTEGAWDESVGRVNILLPPVVWTCYVDDNGTVVEPRDQVVSDGVIKLKYDVAAKQGEDWPWMQIEADLPYDLGGVDSLIVSYASDHPIAIILPQQVFIDDGSFAHYRYTLPAAPDGNTLTIRMDAFSLPDWAPEGSRAVAFKPDELRKIAISPALGEEGGRGNLRVDQIVLTRGQPEAAPVSQALPQTKEPEPVGAVDEAQPAAAKLEAHKVYFSTGSTEVGTEYLPILRDIQAQMDADATLRLQITGFADSLGDPAYNRYLSEERAKAVAGYLSGRGVADERMLVVGQGAEEAPAYLDGGIAKKSERRVEVRLTRGQATP